jgi:hypothetical protein
VDYDAAGAVSIRVASLAPPVTVTVTITVTVAVAAATPPGLLKLAAALLRLAAVHTVAANGLTQIFFGPVDTLLAVVARPGARRAAHQQQDCQDGNQLKILPTISLTIHQVLLDNHVFGIRWVDAGISIQGPFQLDTTSFMMPILPFF